MTFDESTIREAWERSGRKCECQRSSCGHTGRCNQTLVEVWQGLAIDGGWQPHRDVAGNCKIFCQCCYQNAKNRTHELKIQ